MTVFDLNAAPDWLQKATRYAAQERKEQLEEQFTYREPHTLKKLREECRDYIEVCDLLDDLEQADG